MSASGIDKDRSSSGAMPASRGGSSPVNAVALGLANARPGQSRDASPVSVPTAAAARSDSLRYYPPALVAPEALKPTARIFLDILIERPDHEPIGFGRFVGKGRAIKRDALRRFVETRLRIARALDPDDKLADEALRIAKEELVEAGHPICSGPCGYWYAATFAEANEAAGVYDSIQNDAKRKAAFLRAGAERIHGLSFL